MANNIGIFELLAMADQYEIRKEADETTICIETKDADLACDIEEDGTERYYRTGVYNHCVNYAEIDTAALDRLRGFVKLLKANFNA